MIDGKVVNFGGLGQYVHTTKETKDTVSRDVLIHAPTQEHFATIMARGKNKFIEKYDPIEEAKVLKEIEDKKKEILESMEERKEEFVAEGILDDDDEEIQFGNID